MRGLIYKELKMSPMISSMNIMLVLMLVFALIDPVSMSHSYEAEAVDANKTLGSILFLTGILAGLSMGLMTSAVGFPMTETMHQARFYTTSPAGISGVLAAKYAANLIVTAGLGAIVEAANLTARHFAPYKPDLTGLIVFCFSLLVINNAMSLTMTSWFGFRKTGTAVAVFIALLSAVSVVYFLFGYISFIIDRMFAEKTPEDGLELIRYITSSGLFRTMSVVITSAAALIIFVLSYCIGLPGYRRRIENGEEE